MNKNNIISLTVMTLLATAVQAVSAEQQPGTGFIEGSQLSVLNRNYYYNRDNHSGGKDGREWGHSILSAFTSGYTSGTVGFGLDAHAYLALKLDSGRGRNRSDMFPMKSNGASRDESTSAGAAVKMRISRSELKYGDLRPYNPVFALADTRMFPATATGFMFTSSEIDDLYIDAGHFTSGKDYNQTHGDGDFFAGYAGVKGGNVDYLGGSYGIDDNTSVTLYTSRYEDLWRQHYLNGNYTLPLGEQRALNLDANIYRTTEQGQALAGNIDVTAWSLAAAYSIGAHTLTLGYQKIHGDQPLDYLVMSGGGFQDSIYLGNASQYANFNGPNERSWRVGYDLDLSAIGLPGASFSIRHVRGSDIDGTHTSADSAYYGLYGKNDKHHTTDLDARYVVQSGVAKDLLIRVRHARHRMTSGNSNVDVDRFRLVLEYPVSIF